MTEFRVRYKEAPDTALIVRMIRTWHRSDIPEAVMSTSSGPKDYFKNMVFAIFDGDARIDAVTMVRGGSRPFFLIRIGQTYFDMAGKEVEVQQRTARSKETRAA